jgi:hypothetical protein
MTNLTKTDYETIDRIIEAKLKHYNLINEPIVEPKEVVQDEENWQYAKCVSSHWVFKEGVVYPITPFTKNNDTPMVTILDGNSSCNLSN